MANNPTVNWTKSTSGTPTGYVVSWSVNGTSIGTSNVPVTAAQDTSGYSKDYASSFVTALNPGDKVGATVKAVDTVNNLQSTDVATSPTTVTIPLPPGPPQNVTLTLA